MTRSRETSTKALIDYQRDKSASLAHPTNEHYLPLLYVLGAAGEERPQFFNEAFFAGSISMTDVLYRG
jgi:4,5-DOPA dioxygenase extradiol